MSVIANKPCHEIYKLAGTNGTAIVRKQIDFADTVTYWVSTSRGNLVSIHEDMLDAALAAIIVANDGKYRIEMLHSYGWDKCWFEDDDETIETMFDSHADAWAEIDDLISVTTNGAFVESDFRIVKVSN